ncbi:hypothetical protein [Pseudomonas syringae]|uniref:hypothetical protein n=1 Tax=Pseudomonas syringae TaxID=317 RepID=UPI00128EFFE8|nr:hypothetical protein [Pseudomonas syringae]
MSEDQKEKAIAGYRRLLEEPEILSSYDYSGQTEAHGRDRQRRMAGDNGEGRIFNAHTVEGLEGNAGVISGDERF